MQQRAVTSASENTRVRLRVNGIVQGVGFRPFVYRLATEQKLAGFVNNDSHGVLIEIEGSHDAVSTFTDRLLTELPPLAKIVSLDREVLPLQSDTIFHIIESQRDSAAATLISPDIATCGDCLKELFDPPDRRHHYPFTNCTNCGPRYTIVKSIPYDRPFTSMAIFPMCPDCQREYDDPTNRRFHAQPNACPVCGPKLTLYDCNGIVETTGVVGSAVKLLAEGRILAIRGVGGFHLAVDAHNEIAVQELRRRKGRAEKPFALMAPDMASVRRYCDVSAEEEAALQHHTKPIVLLRKRAGADLAESVAPNQKYLGFMLPYTPLHHVLIRGHFDALVMTSGNYSEEPIAIGNNEALDRLQGLADYFVLHDREILQRCDDSIARVQSGALRITRRSRGFVPMPVFLQKPTSKRILAVGGELKNTIALCRGKEVFLSQHIGDLDNPSALAFFEQSVEHLQRILEIQPELIAFDLHPEYLSTQWAMKQPLPGISVQHHHAHLVSVMAEHGVGEKTIGIILDGTGYGTDGTIWGGEVLVGDACGFERHAWLQPVPMPGGVQAIKQPWRMAVSYLHAAYGEIPEDVSLPVLVQTKKADRQVLTQMIVRKLNSPLTSSCGRLFDGVAALLGIRPEVNFEAQAAMELEMLADTNLAYESSGYADVIEQIPATGAIPLAPLVASIVGDFTRREGVSSIAARFHRTLVEMFVRAAIHARERYGIRTVALSGGVYQNTLFFELMLRRLQKGGFTILTHTQVPTNDGGLALGQIVAADAMLKGSKR